jgi:hypothetical protein
MPASCMVNFVADFDASGSINYQVVGDETPQEELVSPRITVARQDSGEDDLYLCVSFRTPTKRLIFSMDFEDASKLAAILMSFTVAEQLAIEQRKAGAAAKAKA